MKKQTIIYIILLFILGLFMLNIVFLKADSGWDTDYDFGGSDWGSSSWDSDWGSSSWDSDWGSSSWDSDWGWGYSSNSSSRRTSTSNAWSILLFQIFIVIIIIILAGALKNNNRRNYLPYGDRYNPDNYFNMNKFIDKHIIAISKIKAEIKDFDEDAFNDMVFDIFTGVQIAWSAFDLDSLNNYLTDELFNTYKSQLKVLKAKKETNEMHDFEKEKVMIIDFKKESGTYAIQVLLNAKFFDYVVNQHNVVLRGKKEYKVDMTYILTFVKTEVLEKNKCPNCGAPLEQKQINKCPYCNSKIISRNYDWILSKKEAIHQRWDD